MWLTGRVGGPHGSASAECHRSLYGYQVRTALTLAVDDPHLAVTFIPLACTGSSIDAGLLGTHQADECPDGGLSCSRLAPAQIDALRVILASARRQRPDRKLDLVLLTIGANDVQFAPLVANVIIEAAAERLLLRSGGGIATPEESSSTTLMSTFPNHLRGCALRSSRWSGTISHGWFSSLMAILGWNRPR